MMMKQIIAILSDNWLIERSTSFQISLYNAVTAFDHQNLHSYLKVMMFRCYMLNLRNNTSHRGT